MGVEIDFHKFLLVAHVESLLVVPSDFEKTDLNKKWVFFRWVHYEVSLNWLWCLSSFSSWVQLTLNSRRSAQVRGGPAVARWWCMKKEKGAEPRPWMKLLALLQVRIKPAKVDMGWRWVEGRVMRWWNGQNSGLQAGEGMRLVSCLEAEQRRFTPFLGWNGEPSLGASSWLPCRWR